MSNIGKNLIEATNYGVAYFHGVIRSETDRTWTVLAPGTDVSRRRFKDKHDVVLPEGADIDRARRWFKERWTEFDGPVSGAEATLLEAKRQRAEAALEALKAGA